MTGGVAFVWDPSGKFVAERNYHEGFVETEVLDECDEADHELVLSLLRQHAEKTRSPLAKRLAMSWPIALRQIVRVAPALASAS